MAYTHKNALRNDDYDFAATPTYSTGRRESTLRAVPDRPKRMFSSIEHIESRQNALVVSIGLHIALLTLLIVLPLFIASAIKAPRYDAVILVPALPKAQILEVTHWETPALPAPKPKPPVVPPVEKPVVAKVEPLKEPPKLPDVKAPEVHLPPKLALTAAEIPQPVLPPAPKPAPEPPKLVVKTDVFDGNPSPAALNLAAKKVQTGGFGDPNGVRGDGQPAKVTNIASLGSFDMPVGHGAGNGSGGANGVRGVVTGTGFGNGAVSEGGSGSGGRGGKGSGGAVQQSGFGDAPSGPAVAEKKRSLENPQTPVEITFKPRPDYTDEARRIKLEGEVVLHVLFTASGNIQVLDVLRGLGHGLDQNAVRAAGLIRYKPASQDGKPIDSTATVHIVFQLAY